MSFTLPDLSLALPEIFLLSAVSVLLIVDLFVSDKNRFFTYMLAQLTLFGCALVTVLGFDGTVRFTFSDMYVDDMLGDMLKLMLYIAVSVAFVYARGYLIERNIFKGEFFTLSLFALLGMMVMVSASNFLTLYLGLEILSLSMYALVALQRDSVRGTESAIKYFVLGAIASGMLLHRTT
jgi:NADH-quinone oxidoreductase subunit N